MEYLIFRVIQDIMIRMHMQPMINIIIAEYLEMQRERWDLLEQMKGKTPSHYYTDVLVEDGKTLKDFLDAR